MGVAVHSGDLDKGETSTVSGHCQVVGRTFLGDLGVDAGWERVYNSSRGLPETERAGSLLEGSLPAPDETR